MLQIKESERLHHFQHGEKPSRLYAAISFKCTYQDCVQRIVSVMEMIVEHDAENWPDDNYWQNRLPSWLLQTFRAYTEAELAAIMADKGSWSKLDWMLGSWLDRVRDRDWQWWSLERKDDLVKIYIVVEGYPFSAKALEHLIKAAGGHSLESQNFLE